MGAGGVEWGDVGRREAGWGGVKGPLINCVSEGSLQCMRQAWAFGRDEEMPKQHQRTEAWARRRLL